MSLVSSTPLQSLILIVNDLEMSGPRLHENFCVSWGSVAYDSVTRQVLGEHLVRYTQPTHKTWDKKCLSEFWLRRKEDKPDEYENPALAEEYHRVTRGEGESPFEGTVSKTVWMDGIMKEFADGNPLRILFVSDTCAPDNMYMNEYLAMISHNPIQLYFGFFRDTFSTSAFALGLLRQELPLVIGQQQYFSEDKMVRDYFKIHGHIRPTAPHDHNPVNDCKNIMEEFWIHCDHAYSKEVEVLETNEENECLIKTHRQLLEEVVHLKAEAQELKKENQEYKKMQQRVQACCKEMEPIFDEYSKNQKMQQDSHPSTSMCPDQECYICAARDCPHGSSMHYDKDGCPSCDTSCPNCETMGCPGCEPEPMADEPREEEKEKKKNSSIVTAYGIKWNMGSEVWRIEPKSIVLLDNNIYRIDGKDHDNTDGVIFKMMIYPCLQCVSSVKFEDGRSKEAKASLPLYAACWPTSVENAKALTGQMKTDWTAMEPIFASYLETVKTSSQTG